MSEPVLQVRDAARAVEEGLNRYHWKTLWSSMAGYAMDGLDLMVLSYVLSLVMKDLHLTSAQAGSISTITLMGSVLGGYLFGILADIYGRVRTFAYSILIFSIFTGLTAFVHNLFWFDVTRFIAGIGLGGEFGIGMTLVSEAWPKTHRSRATSVVAIGFQFGMIIALLCSMVFVPRFGWQSAFLIGALPALFAWWSRRNLEEPEIWRQRQARGGDKAFPLAKLFDSPRRAGITIGLVIMTSVQNFGFYGIMTWLPTMLAKQLGFSFNKSLTWTLVTILGMMTGILLFGQLSDRWGRKPSYLVFQFGSALIVWLFFHQSSPSVLLVLGFLMGFLVDGMMGGYGASMAEHYPTEARSTAENFIFNTGRAVGGFGPYVIGSLAMYHSLSWAMGLLSAIYILAALAVIFLVPESKNKALA
ncbi:MFS transporter [Alicyclobacillus macrosporangiidus]|uniref:MFS transporter n=1 Tax=Alicyclobacillus macrosporangiidus TaxID=392015 RepID=UPI000AF1B1C0|nr:MFS transporter [Alicyclobacillus macrosporangiidus]